MTSLSSILDRLPYWRYTVSRQDTTQEGTVIIQGKTINIIVPKRALAAGSVQIVRNPDVEQPDQQEMYQLHQKILGVFKKQGIGSYLRYAKVSDTPACHWEIVPFSKKSSNFWQQLKVLWNVTFGSSYISQHERELFAASFRKAASQDFQEVGGN